MTTSNQTKRDLQLLSLLIERELEREGCGAEAVRGAKTCLEPDERRGDRFDYELRLDLLKGLRAIVTDTWWANRDREVDDLCRQAADIACSVKALWLAREEIRAMRDEVATAVRREVANAQRRDIPYRMISADICPVEASNSEFPYVHIRLERLGASLLPELVTLKFDAAEQVKPAFAEMLETQMARRMRQVFHQAAGVDGEIDEVALRIMRVQGCDVPAVLARLPSTECGILDVDLNGPGSRGMVLFWRDGVVHANIRLSEDASWNDGGVTFRRIPERFPAKPEGRLLSAFIKHEAIPEELRIVSGYRSGSMASARVPLRTVGFNSQTGGILAA